VRFWDADRPTHRPTDQTLMHPVAVYSLAYSFDGTRLVTGTEDNRARLWDVESRRPLGLPMEHRGSVVAVGFAPDGKSVLTGSGDRTARIWDVATVAFDPPPATFPDRVQAVAYPADGGTVLIGGDDGKVYPRKARDLSPLGPPWDAGGSVRALVPRPGGGAV